MDNWIIEIASAVAGLIVVAAGAYAYWRQWQDADVAKRQEMLAKAAKELVLDAEQTYVRPKAGTAKFGWVMGKLSERFPDVDWDELAGCVEAAVTAMRKEQVSRSVRHRNGTYDA